MYRYNTFHDDLMLELINTVHQALYKDSLLKYVSESEYLTLSKNSKYLYACERVLDAYEYKKSAKYFPQIYWAFVIWGTILNLVFTAIIAIKATIPKASVITFPPIATQAPIAIGNKNAVVKEPPVAPPASKAIAICSGFTCVQSKNITANSTM